MAFGFVPVYREDLHVWKVGWLTFDKWLADTCGLGDIEETLQRITTKCASDHWREWYHMIVIWKAKQSSFKRFDNSSGLDRVKSSESIGITGMIF